MIKSHHVNLATLVPNTNPSVSKLRPEQSPGVRLVNVCLSPPSSGESLLPHEKGSLKATESGLRVIDYVSLGQ